MSRFDLRAIADAIGPRFPTCRVYVDTVYHPPTFVEFRCKHGRVRIWQSGNTHPRVDTSNLMPRDYALLRAVLDAIEGE